MKSCIKIFTVFLISGMIIFSFTACSPEVLGGKVETVKIGVALYRKEDTFVASISDYIEKYAKEKESETGKKIVVNIVDSQSNQVIQNDQVDSFISQNYDVICVNMVDRTAAAVIVDKAKAADIPVILFNRELVEEDVKRWDNAYYVGADADQSGRYQGEIIADTYKKNPSLVDKNGDGKIQYVMLEGEQGHQDALLRTEYAIKAVTNAGIKVEKLANDSANWQRGQGASKMTPWIKTFGDKIEVVFCNNDDMALGAIDAIKSSKVKITPLVIGIDATKEGINAVQEGSMFATVFNDAQAQAKSIFDLCYALINGEDPRKTMQIKDGHYIRIPYHKVNKDNADDILNYLKK